MHISVLKEPILQLFAHKKCAIFVDLTLGAAGHSLAFCHMHPELSLLVGFDQDKDALALAEQNLQAVPVKKLLIHSNFNHLQEKLHEAGIREVDGILIDLGVSSMQFDQGARGFSFQNDGPLDMRMNEDQLLTAEDIVNSYSQEELATIFYELGEEHRSRQAAKAIFEARKKGRIDTTGKLVNVLSKVLFRSGRIHPATKVFQALRLAVNQELDVLTSVIPQAVSLLAPDGILAIISFHSLEDRIVKQAFRAYADSDEYELLFKKPLVADNDECRQNPRSRSAKLRALKKTPLSYESGK
jgi:16S rRNA (cytosine1402-N4)-methyltransferase